LAFSLSVAQAHGGQISGGMDGRRANSSHDKSAPRPECAPADAAGSKRTGTIVRDTVWIAVGPVRPGHQSVAPCPGSDLAGSAAFWPAGAYQSVDPALPERRYE